jgi:hypothetical protein
MTRARGEGRSRARGEGRSRARGEGMTWARVGASADTTATCISAPAPQAATRLCALLHLVDAYPRAAAAQTGQMRACAGEPTQPGMGVEQASE